MQDLEPNRRCFREVGGVLVEKTVEEARSGLQKFIKDELDGKIANLGKELAIKEKQMGEIAKKIGYNIDNSKKNNIQL